MAHPSQKTRVRGGSPECVLSGGGAPYRVDELAAARSVSLPGRPVHWGLIVLGERCHCRASINEPLEAYRVAVLSDEMHRSVATLPETVS